MAVQQLFRGVLLLGFVQHSSYHSQGGYLFVGRGSVGEKLLPLRRNITQSGLWFGRLSRLSWELLKVNWGDYQDILLFDEEKNHACFFCWVVIICVEEKSEIECNSIFCRDGTILIRVIFVQLRQKFFSPLPLLTRYELTSNLS